MGKDSGESICHTWSDNGHYGKDKVVPKDTLCPSRAAFSSPSPVALLRLASRNPDDVLHMLDDGRVAVRFSQGRQCPMNLVGERVRHYQVL